jgi:hypothetical protein
MAKVMIEALLAPVGIYQREIISAKGWAPREGSRFAVVRTNEKAPWRLIHVRSGGSVDSVFPARLKPFSLADKLAVAAAWEAASHVDWGAFDALPQVTRETTQPPDFGDKPISPATRDEMRRLAAQALGVA